MQATRKLAEQSAPAGRGGPVDEESFAQHLAMAYAPEPDLFIRTGGEQRISNFLLWQVAYTEFYFTDTSGPISTPTRSAARSHLRASANAASAAPSAQLEPQSQKVDTLSC